MPETSFNTIPARFANAPEHVRPEVFVSVFVYPVQSSEQTVAAELMVTLLVTDESIRT